MRYLTVVALVVLLPSCEWSPTAPSEGGLSFDGLYGTGPLCFLGPIDAARIELAVGDEAFVEIPDLVPIDLKGELWPSDCPSLEGARFEYYYWFHEPILEVEIESCNCEVVTAPLSRTTRVHMFEPMSLKLRIKGGVPGRALLGVVGSTYDDETNPTGRDGALGDHYVWVTVGGAWRFPS